MKLTFANSKVNDCIKFESLTDCVGAPAGLIASTGDVVYYRITKKISDTCVSAKRGSNHLVLEDKNLDGDVYTVKAQLPCILYDWKLRVSLPTKLPIRYAIVRWLLNLRKHDK